jgi:hypothetical protein
VAVINLETLTSEYHQSPDSITGHRRLTIIGTGKGWPVACTLVYNCLNDLTLGFGGSGWSDPVSIQHALRAVQFLQHTCPPQRLGV